MVLSHVATGSPCFFSCDQTPVETIAFEEDGQGFIQYSTNDREEFNTGQFIDYPSAYSDPMGTVEFDVIKMSGARSQDFGCIYNYVDFKNFDRLLITVDGWYWIDCKKDGIYSTLMGGYQNSLINKGRGAVNRIRITQAGHTYTVYFNMSELYLQFADYHHDSKGAAGFYVLVGDVASG